MRDFRFKLERVLQFRCFVEDKAKHALALSLANLKAEEDRLLMFRQELAGQQHGLAAGAQVNLNQALLEMEYRNYLEGTLSHLEAEVKRSDRQVQKCRANLLDAVQERRVIGRLKERHEGQHNYRTSRLEQRDLDEIGSSMFVRQGREKG